MSRRFWPDDPADIAMWHRLDARLTTSGQPTEEQLGCLPALGVTHLVNLALHSHAQALADEAGSAAALGMAYTNIPVAFDAPTEADYACFAALMDELAGAVVHVHCIANLRVSAFLYRYTCERHPDRQVEAATELERLWRPGGVWAGFIGSPGDGELPHRYEGADYEFSPP